MQRLEYLDSVRGQAALAVVWVHYFGGFGWGAFGSVKHTPLSVFFHGAASISLFFVLSGFVLSYRFFQPAHSSLTLSKFYITRFTRICTPFAFVLVVSKLCNDHITRNFTTDPVRTMWLRTIWDTAVGDSWWDVLEQIPLVTPDLNIDLVPQAWTLTVELQLALLVPFMILIIRRRTTWLLVFLGVCFGLLGLSMFLANFCLGVTLARHEEVIRAWIAARGRATILAISCLALYLYNFRAWQTQYKFGVKPASDGEILIMALGAFMFLALVLSIPSLQRVFMMRPLRNLGKISYSLYLVHFLILVQLAPLILTTINGFGFRGDIAQFIGFLLYTVTALIAATICYILVEKPSQRWGRKLAARYAILELLPPRQ